MNKFKVRDIMKLEPCEDYSEEYIEELWNGKESLSWREILDLDIDIDDRLWVLVRLVPTEILPKWAQYCADKANEYDDATDVDYATKFAKEATYQVAAYQTADTEDDAYWAAYWAEIYATAAARAAANTSKNREEILYELLTTLIEMTEEN